MLSAESAEASKKRYPDLKLHDVFIMRSKRLRDRIRSIRYQCGHRDQTFFQINLYGRIIHKDPAYQKYCGDCMALRFKQNCLRCCRCGNAILDGEAITFYAQHDMQCMPNFTSILIPADPEETREDTYVVGCIDSSCMPHTNFIRGHYENRLFHPIDLNQKPLRIILWSSWKLAPYVFPLIEQRNELMEPKRRHG